jgi:hypothetical protein
MRYIIGLLLFATVPVLGFTGAEARWLLGASLAGVIGYCLIQPLTFIRMRAASAIRGSMWPLASYLAATYVGQLAVCSVLFLAGRGFALLLGA